MEDMAFVDIIRYLYDKVQNTPTNSEGYKYLSLSKDEALALITALEIAGEL